MIIEYASADPITECDNHAESRGVITGARGREREREMLDNAELVQSNFIVLLALLVWLSHFLLREDNEPDLWSERGSEDSRSGVDDRRAIGTREGVKRPRSK